MSEAAMAVHGMNPVVAKLIRADGTVLEFTGEVVEAYGMPLLRFDQAVEVMEGDVLHLEPIVKAQPATNVAH